MDESLPSGEELFLRYKTGDEDAFTELVALYQEGLTAFIYNIVKDKHETEHLTIETFARLAAAKNAFEGRSSLKTYLYTIGKNLASRYVKSRSSQQHLSYEEVILVLADAGETPEAALEREENKLHLQKAISELKEDHKTVLQLLYFDDLSYIEAGSVMGKSETQIKHLAYRAKAALKKKLIES